MKLAWLTIIVAALAVAAQPADAQKAKDNLRFAFQRSTRALDLYLDPGIHTTFTQEAVFDTLISFNEPKQTFEPLLAKSWTRVSPTVLEFDLRDDVTWHDGEKFTADDVVYTLGWLTDKDTKIQFKGQYAWVDKVEKLSPTKVRITAKQPTPFDLLNLAMTTAIMPLHAHGPLANKYDFVTKSVGTGPYRAVNVDTSKGVLLQRNEAFNHGNVWKTKAAIKTIDISLIPDFGTQVAHLLAGDLDLATLPWAEASNFLHHPTHHVEVYPSFSYVYMMFDAKGRSGVKALQDERVRRALMMAIDPAEVYQVIGGDTKVTFPEHICWKVQFGCAYTKLPPAYDPAGAKKLLAEAGYPNGFEVDVYSVDGVYRDVNQAIVGELRRIGIAANVKAMTRAAFQQEIGKGTMPIVATVWSGGGMADVSGTMSYFFAAESKDFIGDDALSAMAAKTDTEMDPAKRKQDVAALLDTLTDHAYIRAVVPAPTIYAVGNDVKITKTAYVAGAIAGYAIEWK